MGPRITRRAQSSKAVMHMSAPASFFVVHGASIAAKTTSV
jgi:hypothetical protein